MAVSHLRDLQKYTTNLMFRVKYDNVVFYCLPCFTFLLTTVDIKKNFENIQPTVPRLHIQYK